MPHSLEGLYMVHWKGTASNGGYVLVALSAYDTAYMKDPKKNAIALGMAKAQGMWPNAEFVKLEEFSLGTTSQVLWAEEWYAK